MKKKMAGIILMVVGALVLVGGIVVFSTSSKDGVQISKMQLKKIK